MTTIELKFVDDIPGETHRRGATKAFLLQLVATGDSRWCEYRRYPATATRQAAYSAGQSVTRSAKDMGLAGVEYKVNAGVVYVRHIVGAS